MGNSNLVGAVGSCYTDDREGCICEEHPEGPTVLDTLADNTHQTTTAESGSQLQYAFRDQSWRADTDSSYSSASPVVGARVVQENNDAGSGGVRSIVLAMAGFIEDALVQTRACKSLAIIARQPVHQDKVVAAGAIEAAVAAMRAHPADVELQLAACNVLEGLAAQSDGQRRLLAVDGAEAIIAAMGNHPDALTIQRCGCQTLVNVPLILEDPKFTTTDAVVGVILSAMRKHPYDCGVQESACGILWCASLHEAGQALVVSCDGIGATVSAMQAFPKEVTLQRLGCGLLLHIVSCNHLQPAVLESGGLAAITQAVQQHASDVRIVRRACCVLSFLAASRDHAENLVQAGAIDTLLRGLPFHQTQISVQEIACEALLALLAAQPPMKERQVIIAMKELVSVLRALHAEAKIQRLGLHCLHRLLWTDVGSRIAGELGVQKAASIALKVHPDDVGVQEAAHAILQTMSTCQQTQQNEAEVNALSADLANDLPAAVGDDSAVPPSPGPVALAAAAEVAAAAAETAALAELAEVAALAALDSGEAEEADIAINPVVDSDAIGAAPSSPAAAAEVTFDPTKVEVEREPEALALQQSGPPAILEHEDDKEAEMSAVTDNAIVKEPSDDMACLSMTVRGTKPSRLEQVLQLSNEAREETAQSGLQLGDNGQCVSVEVVTGTDGQPLELFTM